MDLPADPPLPPRTPPRSLRRPLIQRTPSSSEYATPLSTPSPGGSSAARSASGLPPSIPAPLNSGKSGPSQAQSDTQPPLPQLTSPPPGLLIEGGPRRPPARTPSSTSLAGGSIEGYRRSPSYSAAKEYFESRSRESSVGPGGGQVRSPGPAGTGGLPRKKSNSTLRPSMATQDADPAPLPPVGSSSGEQGRRRPSEQSVGLGSPSPGTIRRRSDQTTAGRRASLTPGSPKGPRQQRRSSEMRRSADVDAGLPGDERTGSSASGRSGLTVNRSPVMSRGTSATASSPPSSPPAQFGFSRPTGGRPAPRPAPTAPAHSSSSSLPSAPGISRLPSASSSPSVPGLTSPPRRRPSRPTASASTSSSLESQPGIAIQQPTPVRTTHPAALPGVGPSTGVASAYVESGLGTEPGDADEKATRRRSADLGRRPALYARTSPGGKGTAPLNTGGGVPGGRRASGSRGLGLDMRGQANREISEIGSVMGSSDVRGRPSTDAEVVLNSAAPSPSLASHIFSNPLDALVSSSAATQLPGPASPSSVRSGGSPQPPPKHSRSNSAASSIVIPRRMGSQSSIYLPGSPSRGSPPPHHTTPPPISPRTSSIAWLADGEAAPSMPGDEEKPKRPTDPDRRPSDGLWKLLSSKLPGAPTAAAVGTVSEQVEGDETPTKDSQPRRASKALASLGEPMSGQSSPATARTERLPSIPASEEPTPTKPPLPLGAGSPPDVGDDATDESPTKPKRNYQNLSIYPTPPPVIRTRRSVSSMNIASGSPRSPGSFASPSPPIPARNPLRLTSRQSSGMGGTGPGRSGSRQSDDSTPAATPTSSISQIPSIPDLRSPARGQAFVLSPSDEIRFTGVTAPSVYSQMSGGTDTQPSTGTDRSFRTADIEEADDAAESPISPASVSGAGARPSIGKRASLAESLTEQGVWGQKREGMTPRSYVGAPDRRLPSPPSTSSPTLNTSERILPTLDRIQTRVRSPKSPSAVGSPQLGGRSPSMPVLRRQDSGQSPPVSPRSTSIPLSTDMIPKRSSSYRSNASSHGYADGIPKRTSSILEDGAEEDNDVTVHIPMGSPRRKPKRDLLPSVLARSPTAPNLKSVTESNRNVSTTSTVSTLSKRSHLLREIANTERAYATDLKLVCEAYVFRHPQYGPARDLATRPGSAHSTKSRGGARDGEADSPAGGSRRGSAMTIDTKRTSLFDGIGGTPKSPAGTGQGSERDRESYFSPTSNGLETLGRKRTSASSISASTSIAATPLSATGSNKRGSLLSSVATPPTSFFSTTPSPRASQFTLTGLGQSGKVRGNPPSLAEMRTVFLNLVELAQAADEFATRLEKAVGEEEDGPGAKVELNGRKGRSGEGGTDKVGQVFVELLPTLRPLYLHYCVRQSAASLRLADLSSSHSLYLSDSWALIRPHTHAWNLETMLIKPVQRITKYPLLFQDLLDSTTPVHPDYFNIRKAAEEARKMAMEIDEAKRRKDIVAQAINRASSPIVLTSETPLRPKEQKKGLKMFRKDKASPFTAPALSPTPSSTSLDLWASLAEVSKRSMQQIVGLVEQLEQAAAATKRIGKEIVMWTAGVKEVLNAEEEMMQTWLKLVVLEEGDREDKRMMAFRGLLNEVMAEDWAALNDKVRNSILPVFARLLESIVNPSRVVTKRAHRLPDYQRYISSVAKRSSPALLDRAILQGAHDFTALHTQLVEELPIFLRGYMRILDLAMCEFAQTQAKYYGALRERLKVFASKWIADPGVATPGSVMSYRGPVDLTTGRGIVKAWHDSWVPFAEAMEHFQSTKPFKRDMSRSTSHNHGLRHSPSTGSNLSPTAAHRAASRGNSPRPESPFRSGSPLARTDSTVAALYRQNLEAVRVDSGTSGAGGRRRSASLRSPAVAALVSPVKGVSRPGMFRTNSKSSLSGDRGGSDASRPATSATERPRLRDPVDKSHRYSFGLPRISNPNSPGLDRVFDELTVAESPSKVRSPSGLSRQSTVAPSLTTKRSDGSALSGKNNTPHPYADAHPSASSLLDATAGLGLGEIGDPDRRISAISTASGASGLSLSSLPSIPSVRSRQKRQSVASDVSASASPNPALGSEDMARRRSSGGSRAFRVPPEAQLVHIPPPRQPSGDDVPVLPSVQEMSPDTPLGRGPAPSYELAMGTLDGVAAVHAAVAATHAAEASGRDEGTAHRGEERAAALSVADGWKDEATIYLCACVADFDPMPWGNKTYRGLPFLLLRTGDILEVLHEVGRTQDAPGFPYPQVGVENDGVLVARSEERQVGLVICSFLEPLRD